MAQPLFGKNLDEPPFDKSGVPSYWAARVQSELRGGERLIWIGQPRPSIYAQQAWPAVLIGAILTTSTSVFSALIAMDLMAISGEGWGKQFAAYFFLPFSWLIGMGLLSAPYWQWKKAKHTCYALTSRRAVLWEVSGFRNVEIRSYRPDDLFRMYRVEYPGGGDLIFDEEGMIRREGSDERIVKTTKHGFLGIDRVHDVEELLRDTLFSDDE